MIRWKNLTGRHLEYKTYQQISEEIDDIPTRAFREAARLIDAEGNIYDGPGAVYKALSYGGRGFLFNIYSKVNLFRYISDHAYWLIAKNRRLFFTLTKAFWGKDPSKPKPYWLLIALIIAGTIVVWNVL